MRNTKILLNVYEKKKLSSKLVTQLIDQYIQDPDFEPANHSIEGKFIKRKTTK